MGAHASGEALDATGTYANGEVRMSDGEPGFVLCMALMYFGVHVVVPLQLEWFTKGDSKGSIVLTNFLVKCAPA